MPQPNDLSRSLVALDQDSTIIAVVELRQSSWLVGGVLPALSVNRVRSWSLAQNDCLACCEGERNPRDRAAGPDRLILPAMQQGEQPFGARIQLLARLTLNTGKHAGNEPARLAQLDYGNDCAILVQGDEGFAQIVRLGHRGTPSIKCSDEVAISSPPAP